MLIPPESDSGRHQVAGWIPLFINSHIFMFFFALKGKIIKWKIHLFRSHLIYSFQYPLKFNFDVTFSFLQLIIQLLIKNNKDLLIYLLIKYWLQIYSTPNCTAVSWWTHILFTHFLLAPTCSSHTIVLKFVTTIFPLLTFESTLAYTIFVNREIIVVNRTRSFLFFLALIIYYYRWNILFFVNRPGGVEMLTIVF